MPNPEQIRMEDMSEAYVRALCAADGYSVEKGNHDNDGVDITVSCKGKPLDSCKRKSPKLDIQLKSSYSKITVNSDGSISYPLEVKNYNWLIDTERITPFILVVFLMPDDETQWLEHTIDWLKIKKCAYWISLRGKSATTNTSSVTIKIPPTNILTKDTLRDLMVKIANDRSL